MTFIRAFIKTKLMKIKVVFLLLFAAFQSCDAQQQRTLIMVENHLNDELDYAQGALEFEYKKINGERVTIGKINTDGTIEFKIPDYDIKAIHDSINLRPNKFQQWFSIDSNCKDRDVFAKTPYDDVYSNKMGGMLIKKYGIYVATLEAVVEEESSEHIKKRNYFWLNVDRAITYKEQCSKVSQQTGEVYDEASTNIELEKGWNFIEENRLIPKNSNDESSKTTQITTTKFSTSSPSAPDVKWTLRQIEDDEKIETAKRLFHLTPIPKEKFEKWAPNKLADLSVFTKEHGNPPRGQKNKNNMHLIYADKGQQKEIDLYVIDAAKNPNDLDMINFAYAMEYSGKDEKDIKPYVTQYNEQTKATQLLYKLENRILIIASGINMNGEELWGYIQKMKVEKLLE